MILAAACNQPPADMPPTLPPGEVVEAEFIQLVLTPAVHVVNSLHVELSAPDVLRIRRGLAPHVQTTTAGAFPHLLAMEARNHPRLGVLLCVAPDVPYGVFVDVLRASAATARRTVLNPPPPEWRGHHAWVEPESRVSILDTGHGEFVACSLSLDASLTTM